MAEQSPKLTPRMTQAMRRAARMARERDRDYIGTEHVLLALLEDTVGIAGGVAMRLFVSERLRQGIHAVMDGPGSSALPDR